MNRFLQLLFGGSKVVIGGRVVIGATYEPDSDDTNPFRPRRRYHALVLERRGGWVSYRYVYPDTPTIKVETPDYLPEDIFLSIYRRCA